MAYSIFQKIVEQETGMKLIPEYKFCETRRYKFDYAIPDLKVGIEVDGGIYSKQAHGSISGILRDIEKLNLATSLGWAVIRMPSDKVNSNMYLQFIYDIVKLRKAKSDMPYMNDKDFPF